MELKLVVVSGKTNKGAVTLRPPIVIGRSRQAELTVAHPMISRRHCEIFEVAGLAMIRDLGSLNGTVVEGQRVRESPLGPGREFSLGPLTFRAEYEYTGELDSLPVARVAPEQGQSGQAGEETPSSPQADPPAAVQPVPSLDASDQVPTEAVGGPNQEEAVVEIVERADAGQEETQEP
jgi:pSer/pThr/pTyr-binding forkhead associated (FHA) protein